MRSFNEGWALRQTLPALHGQDWTHWELIVIDSGSTDGSVDLIRQAGPRHFVQIPPQDYNPARVMNLGMTLARSNIAVFLNADATPIDAGWLRPLAEAVQDELTAAAFGCQIPRPDCRAVFAHDYARCFGPNRVSTCWEHFFSMVSTPRMMNSPVGVVPTAGGLPTVQNPSSGTRITTHPARPTGDLSAKPGLWPPSGAVKPTKSIGRARSCWGG